MSGLAGRVALVTGGGSGIGAAICLRLAEAGARVFVTNRSDAGQEVAESIVKTGGEAAFQTLNVANKSAVEQAVATAAERFGALDIVVHNAGYAPWARLDALKGEDIAQALAVNLMPCFWLTRAALPFLRKSKAGRILVTSSVTGPRVAVPGGAAYAAAKAGVGGFVRAAALELAPEGITVNAVEPGMIAKREGGGLSRPEHRDKVERFIPMGHMGEADDIAHLMVFLAGDGAKYITGQCWPVDGGALLVEMPTFTRRTPKEPE